MTYQKACIILIG